MEYDGSSVGERGIYLNAHAGSATGTADHHKICFESYMPRAPPAPLPPPNPCEEFSPAVTALMTHNYHVTECNEFSDNQPNEQEGTCRYVMDRGSSITYRPLQPLPLHATSFAIDSAHSGPVLALKSTVTTHAVRPSGKHTHAINLFQRRHTLHT
eukprot:2392623-Prymnesium_polylepis.1